ncbi:MBL fold metallo-hydrolase [Pedobacter alpinus]|uniref:MBL fold metallo-hydrolase n=1 Tax=Pedobacter alpinus TaxID=1590643 RepID=A0ABW5TPV3_9SPHI
MIKKIAYLPIILITLAACSSTKNVDTATSLASNNQKQKMESGFNITPIEHATASFTWAGTQFYIDPVGSVESFGNQPKPDVVLITDIHGDHLDAKTLASVIIEGTKIIVPQAVADKLPADMKARLTILANNQTIDLNGFKITGVPMYNLREEAKQFHTKGRGNGYVIEKNGLRVYFSGDTEDIPEMRNLKNIDKAFVCMNLPYTMTEDKAADAVLAFKPKQVYPYHYRGGNGLSDVAKFKELVNKGNSKIEVVQLNWYPKK